jgi:hypothetical protein
MSRSKENLDKRDRRVLHAVRVAAQNAIERARLGHNDGWQPLQDALDTADDELGVIEDFEP